MPELPEVQALCDFLTDQAAGKTIDRVEVTAISVLKTYDPPVDALVGKTITGCRRKGKYLEIHADPIWLVLHLARGGWVQWRAEIKPGKPTRPNRGPLALRVRLDDGSGFDVTEAGTEKRLAAWVVNDPEDIENVATLGPDPLDADFDAAVLGSRLAGASGHVKHALTDQRLIAGVGNAYSDEALHVARLSPFKPAAKLSDDEVARLHGALVGVLRDAVGRSAGLPAGGLKSEKKSGMRVHGRAGETCPECGDTVREVSFATKSLQYCATCQTGGKPLADRRMSRLLK